MMIPKNILVFQDMTVYLIGCSNRSDFEIYFSLAMDGLNFLKQLIQRCGLIRVKHINLHVLFLMTTFF